MARSTDSRLSVKFISPFLAIAVSWKKQLLQLRSHFLWEVNNKNPLVVALHHSVSRFTSHIMSDHALSWKTGGRRPSQLIDDEDIVFQDDAPPNFQGDVKRMLPRPQSPSLAPVRDERIQVRQR